MLLTLPLSIIMIIYSDVTVVIIAVWSEIVKRQKSQLCHLYSVRAALCIHLVDWQLTVLHICRVSEHNWL